jgi:hypothetical protein
MGRRNVFDPVRLYSGTALVGLSLTVPGLMAVTASVAVCRWFSSLCALCVLGNRTSNCIINAQIKGAKFTDLDWHSGFKGKLRDGLADIAVIPNNLFNRESLKK